MSRFGQDPRSFFDSVYRGTPPWDVEGPQPALLELFDDYPPEDPVLDLGCGSGDHAIALARRGLQVLGIDFVETAILQAREKAAVLAPKVAQLVEFQVADALQPSRLKPSFGAAVDSGFFHLFDPDQGYRFIDDLATTLIPGGRYYLLAFGVEFSIPNTPRAVTEEELRVHFTPEKGWRVLEIRPAEFRSRIAPVPAVSACIERQPA